MISLPGRWNSVLSVLCELRGQDEFFFFCNKLLLQRCRGLRDRIVRKINYSKVQSVISCTGEEAGILLQMLKGSSVSCPLQEQNNSIVRHQQLHTDATVCTVSLSLACALSHPDVLSALSLSSFCCCIINLACLNLIGLYLTSQSIAQIPLLLPRVFSKSGASSRSLASTLTKYLSLFYFSLRKII